MRLTTGQALITLAVTALATMITRFLPFILFPEGKKYPKIIDYLSKVLPPAMMGLLVINCLKNVSVFESSRGIPEAAAILSVVIIHIWRRNVLLSIALGTALYMFLVQAVF